MSLADHSTAKTTRGPRWPSPWSAGAALIAAVVREEARRRAAGRQDHIIPMRPDHGQDILDDLGRRSQPGYPTIGRMKGLAELRGVMAALEHQLGKS